MRYPRTLGFACLLSIARILSACASVGTFVWVDDITPAQLAADYIIGSGDVITMKVFGQDSLTTEARVRTDGKLTVPFLGDVDATGKRPGDLRRELEAGLKPFLVQPSVILTIKEARPLTVTVLGEVARPGVIALEPGAGLAQVLANAGGPNDFADRERMFVVRKTPHLTRIRFTYESVTRGIGRAAAFTMQPGDVVVVE
jgi:polysaccharide biosynthesis/export protein